MKYSNILWLIGCVTVAIFVISFTLTYLWPLVLVLGIVFVIRVLQTRKKMKEAEEQARIYQENPQQFYQDAMYHSYNSSKSNDDPMIIDAEVSEVKEEKVD